MPSPAGDADANGLMRRALNTSAPHAERLFVTFDGGVRLPGALQAPDRYRYWDNRAEEGARISRGGGLSYAAASFIEGGVSVSHAAFNRIIGFDSATRVVEVESGITLYALHRFLVRYGLYLPIQPGHGRITVGGCVAADVHGKNHVRDGTFMNQVESLTLFHPSHGVIELSREREPELFRLTCGGYGLTGHIVRVRLRAVPMPGHRVALSASRFSDANVGLTQLAQAAGDVDFAYTWHDMTKGGKSFGEGYVFQAGFISDTAPGAMAEQDSPPPDLSATWRAAWPVCLLNHTSVRAMNWIYRFQQRAAMRGKIIGLEDALFPIHKAQAYFRLFGAKGFHEYQMILPALAMREYLTEIKTQLRQKPIPVTLASGKAFSGVTELLRFTGEGICFALNFPRSAEANDFLDFLDDRAVALGGRPNIIKDSRLSRTVVDACYPAADEFRAARRAFDPKRLFRSELSERLGL